MSKRVQAECEDKTCQFCTGKHCKILNQKLEGECTFRKERKSKAEQKKERYQERKENHLCVQCQKQDAYTVSGKTLCFECSQKRRKTRKKFYLKNSKEILEKEKEERSKCLQQGICPDCKRRMAEEGYKICSVCRAKERTKYKKYAENKGVITDEMLPYLGVCHRCRREPLMQGKNVCKSCYEKLLKCIEKANIERARIAASKVKSNNLYY